MNSSKFIAEIQLMYPDIEWSKFFDADRALNWELWHGVLPEGYWKEAEPLEHYVWKDWEKAQTDIIEILSDLPAFVYYECDTDCILLSNPEDDEANWYEDMYGNWEWCGYDYEKVDPRKVVMHDESYKQIF
jgi:hypothetical protein